MSFKDVLFRFLTDINRYFPTQGSTTLLEKFPVLNMDLVKRRMTEAIHGNEETIKAKDPNLFANPFIILPDMDISKIQEDLTEKQRNKIWVYLNLFVVLIDVEEHPMDPTMMGPMISRGTDADRMEIKVDPFAGVGDDEMDVNRLSRCDYSAGEDNSSGIPGSGISGQINKLLDLNALQDQLNAMNDDDIDRHAETITKMMGNNMTDGSKDLVGNMMRTVTDKIKVADFANGKSSIENIMEIAETVAADLKPVMDQNKEDLVDIFQNGGDANPFKHILGMLNNMGPNGINPMAIMQQMMMNPQMMHQMMNPMPAPNGSAPKPESPD